MPEEQAPLPSIPSDPTFFSSLVSTSILLSLDNVAIDPSFAFRLPPSVAFRKKILPLSQSQGTLFVACQEIDPQTIQLLERHFEKKIIAYLAEPQSLERALLRIYGKKQTARLEVRSLSAPPSDTETEHALERSEEILHAAIVQSASDIHLLPESDALVVRFRINGALEAYQTLNKSLQAGLLSRFKVLGHLDIAEKRAPQDGSFRYQIGEATYDIRIATLPTEYGERLTLRILGLQTESFTLERLGMTPQNLQHFSEALKQSSGFFLFAGPTGCGKTTTLYASIRELLQRESCNIISVEDPIEYKIRGVTQVKVDSQDKVSFSKALRSILRHDPDVVVIGEIRDQETADVAIKASLTGHLVFSTLHTHSAIGVLTRFLNMGIPGYLLGSTLKVIVAQRLVRRNCTFCRTLQALTPAQARYFQMDPSLKLPQPQGCVYCGFRTFQGRIGLFEILFLDALWAQHLSEGASEASLQKLMQQYRFPSFYDDGREKILQGEMSGAALMATLSGDLFTVFAQENRK